MRRYGFFYYEWPLLEASNFVLSFKVPMTPKFLLHDVKEYLKL